MFWTTLIAHGILGPYDEAFIPLVALVFLAMIGITWLRSRNAVAVPPSSPKTSEAPKNVEKLEMSKPDRDDSHFTLD